MQAWITWVIAFFTTTVQWLGSMQIMGVSVLWIMGATYVIALLFKVLLYKP